MKTLFLAERTLVEPVKAPLAEDGVIVEVAELPSRADFKILSNTPSITEFVKVPSSLPEPIAPVKSNRPLLIAASLIFSLAAGIGLVCLLERVDHAVKVPEHASHGLTLPLLGVVPRIRRTAITQRGSTCGRRAHPIRWRPTPIATCGRACWGSRTGADRSSRSWSPAPRRARGRVPPP